MVIKKEKIKIGIIGLGYVGLPILNSFKKKFSVVGFDTDKKKIDALLKSNRSNKKNIYYSSNKEDLESCNIYIVAVPTPINYKHKPDLSLLKKATKTVGQVLSKNDIVIFESTVYPGTTEDICVPILERISKLKYLNSDSKEKKGFYCGYSPERINPGDEVNTFENIIKIVSGSSRKALKTISMLYSSVISAGVHETKDIRTAEAAKIIENIQRDLNIALINELAMLFNKMNLNTNEIIEAASTKWNFQKFTPGLVGGHCIGVDPYYLMYKAKEIGFNARLITQGRKINDGMSKYISDRLIKLMTEKNISLHKSNVLILGFTFKENLEDVRNSKVFDIYNILTSFGVKVSIYDPIADKNEVKKLYNLSLIKNINYNYYDAVILAVAHDSFKKINKNQVKRFCKTNSVIYDVKGFFDREFPDEIL